MTKREAAKNGEEKEEKKGRQILSVEKWAEKLNCVASATGAVIRFEMDPKEEMGQTEFEGIIDKYKNGQSA